MREPLRGCVSRVFYFPESVCAVNVMRAGELSRFVGERPLGRSSSQLNADTTPHQRNEQEQQQQQPH